MIIKMVNIHLFMLILLFSNDKFKPNTQINKTIFKLTKYQQQQQKRKNKEDCDCGFIPFIHIHKC